MHKRHAQRKHIVLSLDTLLYQLHALSFILSPSIWPYLCRVVSQTHFPRPREIDPKRSLRFWFCLIVLFNAGSVWSHATTDPGEGRSVILDFVGMGHRPSRFHLLALDALIVFLTMLLTAIAYENTLLSEMPPDTADPFQSIPDTSSSYDDSPLGTPKVADDSESPYVLEVRLAPIIHRLRSPVPVVEPRARNDADTELLPLPNAVPWQRLLIRARASAQNRARREARVRDTEGESAAGNGERRTIPGALDVEEGN